tara:strand:- start:1203 stop:1409 length:207 start_codon:yes stop_codon:yes gene_type:complete
MYGKMKKMKKGGKKFPDLTGDGKVTRADVLKGRGVFKEGGMKTAKKKKMYRGGGSSDINASYKDFLDL